MIEVRFTTDAFPMVAVTAEVYVKGRTPKIARCGGALSGLYDAQSSDCHLFDGELSVFVDCNKGKKPLPYIIVQIQLVFNQFFCFYMNSF